MQTKSHKKLDMKHVFVFMLLGFSFQQFSAQDIHKNEDSFQPHHSISFIISHTQISQGVQSDGNRKWLSLPSWGVNYNYYFQPKWAIGLHNDIIVEDFVVEEHLKSSNSTTLERSYPIASALVGSFKPGKHFAFLVGAGGEFAHTGNFFLIRAGIEYSTHITKSWELNAVLANDYKLNAYNSWAIGLGITKQFKINN